MAYLTGLFSYDSFDGVALMIGSERAGPGTPQIIQPEKLPGIDGVRVLHHGRDSRIIELGGFVMAANIAALLDGEIIAQELLGYSGQAVHYVGGSYRYFNNCRLVEYYLYGAIGTEPGTGYVDQNARAVLAQDVW